ncbi:hypothetical protein K3H43_01285 [Aeromonas veronii]|uniref:hypothetical protein n=2 Tax=Aeromonas TaxID=642 RepID=UPI001F2DBFDA|nr:hypothetical protein [Aeromonas veronii]MCF5726023.1 hypothetical protein [Aeromonas veronii]HDO1319358.1 hypothetical protein [Aeromonas veronii]
MNSAFHLVTVKFLLSSDSGDRMEELKKVEELIVSFFCESHDFNGIPLRQISQDLGLEYEYSIDLVKELVKSEIASIQSSSNPHIIGFSHHKVDSQLQVLDHAKTTKVESQKIGVLEISIEKTEYPICVYPTKILLEKSRDLTIFGNAKYTTQLALAEPQLTFRFFETDVLERYSNDPRFDFKFHDFNGSISCQYDEDGNPILREEDRIFLKSFGLGFDSESNRVVVVLLRDLSKLSWEHQVYWSTKEIPFSECKVLEDHFNNVILGQWITSKSMFSALIDEINAIYKLTASIFGTPLFLKEFDGQGSPKNFTFFFSPTSKNYYDFINLLDKLLSENINKSFFEGTLELEELKLIDGDIYERVRKGTLRLLEEWIVLSFRFPDNSYPSKMLNPLKKVRKERQTPAHKVVDNKYDKSYFAKQKSIMEDCYFSITSLRRNLQTHPEAHLVELAPYLDKVDVKYF